MDKTEKLLPVTGALTKVLAMIGQPTDGVDTLHDRDIIPISFEVSGRDLKAWHRAVRLQSSACGGEVERLREALGDAQEWIDKRRELYDWTGSAWMAGEEKHHPPEGLKAFLSSLIGFLISGEEAVALASPPASNAAARSSQKLNDWISCALDAAADGARVDAHGEDCGCMLCSADARVDALTAGARVDAGEKLAQDSETLAAQATNISEVEQLRAYARGIRRGAALATHPVEGLTGGWKLVPVEPTEAMRAAAGKASSGYEGPNRYQIEDAWSAMLAAAPKATATASVREAVARIINPEAFRKSFLASEFERLGVGISPKVDAYAKADRIIATLQDSGTAASPSTHATDAASPATAPGSVGEGVLEWFSTQHRLSLDYYSPWFADDDDEAEEWRVSKESGPINDREWDIVGRGATASDALAAAYAALHPATDTRDQGGEAS